MKLNIQLVNYKLAVSKDCDCEWHAHGTNWYHMRCNACEIEYSSFLRSHARRNWHDGGAWRGYDENRERPAKDFVGWELQTWNK